MPMRARAGFSRRCVGHSVPLRSIDMRRSSDRHECFCSPFRSKRPLACDSQLPIAVPQNVLDHGLTTADKQRDRKGTPGDGTSEFNSKPNTSPEMKELFAHPDLARRICDIAIALAAGNGAIASLRRSGRLQRSLESSNQHQQMLLDYQGRLIAGKRPRAMRSWRRRTTSSSEATRAPAPPGMPRPETAERLDQWRLEASKKSRNKRCCSTL